MLSYFQRIAVRILIWSFLAWQYLPFMSVIAGLHRIRQPNKPIVIIITLTIQIVPNYFEIIRGRSINPFLVNSLIHPKSVVRFLCT